MLKQPDLKQWRQINQDYTHNLLLGNGASIAVDGRFSYKKLYDEVANYSALNKGLLKLFEKYQTTNFELILRLLVETHRVNEVLGITEGKTMQYYLELRDSLIKTVANIHPQRDEVEHHLGSIGKFMSGFKTVLSLNYDLLVYWAMLMFNETHGCRIHVKKDPYST